MVWTKKTSATATPIPGPGRVPKRRLDASRPGDVMANEERPRITILSIGHSFCKTWSQRRRASPILTLASQRSTARRKMERLGIPLWRSEAQIGSFDVKPKERFPNELGPSSWLRATSGPRNPKSAKATRLRRRPAASSFPHHKESGAPGTLNRIPTGGPEGGRCRRDRKKESFPKTGAPNSMVASCVHRYCPRKADACSLLRRKGRGTRRAAKNPGLVGVCASIDRSPTLAKRDKDP